jgi:cellulose biosynthesis protein BcsQ
MAGVLRATISQRVAWREALLSGQGVAQYNPRDRAAKEVKALVDELLVFAAGAGDVQEVANG